MTSSKKVDTSRPPLEYFDLTALCKALRTHASNPQREAVQHTSGKTLAYPGPARFDELTLFRQLIPESDYPLWMDAGYQEIFLLTFALRHQLGRLSLAAHAHVLEQSGASPDNPHYAFMDDILCRSVKTDLDAYRPFVSPRFWLDTEGETDLYPVIGTSALGAHILFARPNTCRAFDAYAGTQCTKSTHDLFCREHESDAWWVPKPDSQYSPFAKMALFYAFVHNANSYSEDDLEQMVGSFWERYAGTTQINTVSPELFERAARYFGIANADELAALGPTGLKQRYFREAIKHHPDVGGTTDHFIELKTHFELLKRWMAQ